MFELSVACKYLLPRRRQLSVSIISLISILVISLVVWLIVVFFSVTDGLEKSWVNKLTALTAPLRITPTDAYYNSYYYMIDSISDASDYSNKTIKEKLEAIKTDPYNPEMDQEIPSYWPTPDRETDGSLKDPVKLAYAAVSEIQGVPGLQAHDYELTASHIRIKLLRPAALLHSDNLFGGTTQTTLSYPTYLGNFEPTNPALEKILLPLENRDVNNVFSLLSIAPPSPALEDGEGDVHFNQGILRERLLHFFSTMSVQQLQSRSTGWNIPRNILPSEAQWTVSAVLKGQKIARIIVPQKPQENALVKKSLENEGLKVVAGTLSIHEGKYLFTYPDSRQEKIFSPSITLAGNTLFKGELDAESINKLRQFSDLRFKIELPIQGTILKGTVSARGLEIAKTDERPLSNQAVTPRWVFRDPQSNFFTLPEDPNVGEGVILPKSFRDVGVMVGDRGALSYLSPSASTLQEQEIPIYVAGFYDPGIIPIGGKFILANQQVTSLIRSSHQPDDKSALTNGINVRFNDFNQADFVKAKLLESFQKNGIGYYWKIETFREYEFTKEIIRELQSQKNLFLLIALVIILVACSNIISMLVILVNDKKAEIGILRSMGASSKSIAFIFGLSGAIIGVIGSVTGIAAAILTLHNLDTLVSLLSNIQGHEMFNSHFYGKVLPSELSFEALSFVVIATIFISLLAGIVPAIKASLLKPSQILRASGG